MNVIQKTLNLFGLCLFGVVVLLGLITWQIDRQFENMKILNDNFDYQISQMRSLMSANATIVDVGNMGGKYYPSNMNILIYSKGRSISSVHNTALHEIGHYIYYEILTEDEKDEWNNLEFDCYPSKYAEQDHVENFAESYQYWYHNNLTCELQLDFFNNISEKIQT